jgi:tungstate transport system substrate-binding protein
MRHRHRALLVRTLLVGVLVTALALMGCQSSNTSSTTTETKPASTTELILSSTTSTQDSGLFDELIPAFETAYPQYKVKVIAVGTGEALKLGQTGDADVMLVHSKPDEEKAVAEGWAAGRYDVMYNDFIIVGPAADPAGVKGSANTAEAMTKIAAAGKAGRAQWVSRGDDSGTNKKENKLWAEASVDATSAANKSWYLSTGQGMGETLKVASEKGAYTLADRATYLSMKDSLDLVILYEKDKSLLNQYGVLPVTEAKNLTGAQDFTTYVTSDEGQKLIGEYGVAKYGQPLFTANATGTAEFAK